MRSPLDPSAVRAAVLTADLPWQAVEFHPAIGSTNDRARELVEAYAVGPATAPSPLWHVVLTDHQTGGRGRLGRAWQVPKGAAVAVSAIVPARDAASAAWAPLLAGLALAAAITDVSRAAGCEVTPRLKWPNDVLLAQDDDRKVSGILCELVTLAGGTGRGSADRPRPSAPAVIVGTGVNIDQTRAELPVDTATSLALVGASVRREHLVGSYLRHLAAVLGAASSSNGEGSSTGEPGEGGARGGVAAGVRAAYERGCSTIGREVRVHLPTGSVVDGTATGVDAAGCLVVQTGEGPRTFAAGDVVHVRRPDGRLA